MTEQQDMNVEPAAPGPEQAAHAEAPPESAPPKKGFLKRFIWPVVKIPLYVGFLIVSVALLFLGLDKAAELALGKSQLGEIYPKDFSLARRDFTRPVSHYDYDFNPGVCLEYNILKGNRFEYANNAGFREPRDISVPKPADEYRIFLVGGSTAYGLGAIGETVESMDWYSLEYRETISHVMEKILNASAPIPGKKIRVYNTAVWGYSYQHHLMRYMTKLRRYEPDCIVSFDGANEIAPLCKLTEDWNYFKEGQFNNILREIFAYNDPGLLSYLTLWLKNNTFLMTYLWGGRDVFTELHQKGPNFQPEGVTDVDPSTEMAKLPVETKSRLLDRNVATVVRVVEDFHAVMANDRIPHLFVLQPWFYSSNKKHSEKEEILAKSEGHREYYGAPSAQVYKLFIDKLIQGAKMKGYFVVDFHRYFDDVTEWVFTDWCHLTAGANFLIAKELANRIKEHVLGMPLTEADRIGDKDGYFWDLAASSTVVFAPPPDSPENDPKKMLAGYPGGAFYSSKPPGADERFEVVLDLGHVEAASRLRLVWADKASVPAEFSVDVSEDGETWQPLYQGDTKNLDDFARWPGIEHYAPQPLPARFFRYRPLGTERGPIKLRLWSVMR
jgi:hypothetical protein